jgi:hypothetical protein
MSALSFDVPKGRLTDGIENGSDYLRPLLLAVRDHGCAFAIVPQGRQVFEIPFDRPTMVLIGDDFEQALGPSGFHRASLKRTIRRINAAVIVSSAAHVVPYATAAAHAVGFGRHVVIVETLLKFEQAWISFVERYHPEGISTLVSTVRPDVGVQ